MIYSYFFTKDFQDFQFHNHFFHNLQSTQNQYLDIQNTDKKTDKELDKETDEKTDEETDEENGDDDKIEDKLSDKEEFENIIDKVLNENKMPSYNNDNEFAPYFENFTIASLFC